MTTVLTTSQTNTPAGFIDLGSGDPPFSLLPLELIRNAAEIRLAGDDPALLQYGAEQGDGYFRVALADFLGRGYGLPVSPEGLLVTNGVSQGLDLICTLFMRPEDVIFVEEPSYFLALRIFADHALRIIPIATDEDGLVIEALEEKLAEFRPKFLYLIPTFQNPTGRTLSEERRRRLVSLSRSHDFLILADEVYHFLSYTNKLPKGFAAYTDFENVISLGSFSKILAPGLRLGWIQAHPEKIRCFSACGLLDSGGGLNPFTSAIVRGILETGALEKNIAKLVSIFSSRVVMMDSLLRQHLPDVNYSVPQGGYFFWVSLPGQVDAEEFQKKAEMFKVGFRAGVRFSSQGGMRDRIRLSCVFYSPEEIETGILRLKQCLDEG